ASAQGPEYLGETADVEKGFAQPSVITRHKNSPYFVLLFPASIVGAPLASRKVFCALKVLQQFKHNPKSRQ
ncbi:MAG: hypothetical protein RLN95_05695, partial [Nitratireductor sp.]